MTSTDIALIVGCVSSVLAFLTLVANMFYTNYKEARNRQWHLEDAERAKVETERVVRHVGANVQQTVVLKAEEATEARVSLAKQVEEGTKASVAALKEANDVNAKIAALGETIPKKVIVANPGPISVEEVKP